MIEINLLPENLHSKKQIAIELDTIIFFSKLGIIVLVAIHALLLFTFLVSKYRYHRLDKEWSRLSSQNADVISLKKQVNAFKDRISLIDRLTESRTHWAERLQSLSLLLPKGIWFNHIHGTEDSLDIAGSVVSLQANEVEILHKFLQALKKDTLFYSGFKNIDIVSIVRSNLFGVEVVDFSIRGASE